MGYGTIQRFDRDGTPILGVVRLIAFICDRTHPKKPLQDFSRIEDGALPMHRASTKPQKQPEAPQHMGAHPSTSSRQKRSRGPHPFRFGRWLRQACALFPSVENKQSHLGIFDTTDGHSSEESTTLRQTGSLSPCVRGG